MKTWKASKSRVAITAVLGVLALTLVAIAGCGGDSDVKAQPTAVTPISTTAPTATATLILATTAPTEVPPTATSAPEPTAAIPPTVDDMMGGAGDDLALGKLLFEKTAGNVGCAFCHGMNGEGDGPSGIGAPANAGATMDRFEWALDGGETDAMTFLKLTTAEKKAVVAYLQTLPP